MQTLEVPSNTCFLYRRQLPKRCCQADLKVSEQNIGHGNIQSTETNPGNFPGKSPGGFRRVTRDKITFYTSSTEVQTKIYSWRMNYLQMHCVDGNCPRGVANCAGTVVKVTFRYWRNIKSSTFGTANACPGGRFFGVNRWLLKRKHSKYKQASLENSLGSREAASEG